MHLIVVGGCGEATIVGGDDSLLAHNACEAGNPLGHELGVLDQVDAVRDHAGDEHLVVRELHVLPDLPLMLVARIRRFEGEASGVDGEQQVDEVLQLQVVGAGPDVDAVAGVIPHPIRGEAAERMVQELDLGGDRFSALLQADARVAIPVRG